MTAPTSRRRADWEDVTVLFDVGLIETGCRGSRQHTGDPRRCTCRSGRGTRRTRLPCSRGPNFRRPNRRMHPCSRRYRRCCRRTRASGHNSCRNARSSLRKQARRWRSAPSRRMRRPQRIEEQERGGTCRWYRGEGGFQRPPRCDVVAELRVITASKSDGSGCQLCVRAERRPSPRPPAATHR